MSRAGAVTWASARRSCWFSSTSVDSCVKMGFARKVEFPPYDIFLGASSAEVSEQGGVRVVLIHPVTLYRRRTGDRGDV